MNEIDDIIARETGQTYTTPKERAAYRAGMSTAAAICDDKARKVEESNPGRGKGSVSQIGMFGAGIAKGCGDAIMAARDKINTR